MKNFFKKTRSHIFGRKIELLMSYIILDLWCLPCQEQKLILLNLRQILATELKRWRTLEAAILVKDFKLFFHPEHLAAHKAAKALMFFEGSVYSIK